MFKVNKFITLKLEDEKTNIYIKGEFFQQCKRLVLKVDLSDSVKEMSSVDEIIDVEYGEPFCIPPEIEFWGHCSNLQVWAENKYDTHLLHSNLSFPLLRKLSEAGDPTATLALKEEILLRLESGFENVILYLLKNDYLDHFSKEELIDIYHDHISNLKKSNILLPFLRAFYFQDIPVAIKYYNRLIRKLVLTEKFEKKKEILTDHLGILSKEDLLFIFEKLKSESVPDKGKSLKFEVLDIIMTFLHSQYNVSFGSSEVLATLLYEDQQEHIVNIFESSLYPYIKLDFQADEVRRRIWEKQLYYELHRGHVLDIEILCEDSHSKAFYENLGKLKNLKELRCINVLIFCAYDHLYVESQLLQTVAKKINIYEFLRNKRFPEIWKIRSS